MCNYYEAIICMHAAHYLPLEMDTLHYIGLASITMFYVNAEVWFIIYLGEWYSVWQCNAIDLSIGLFDCIFTSRGIYCVS